MPSITPTRWLCMDEVAGKNNTELKDWIWLGIVEKILEKLKPEHSHGTDSWAVASLLRICIPVHSWIYVPQQSISGLPCHSHCSHTWTQTDTTWEKSRKTFIHSTLLQYKKERKIKTLPMATDDIETGIILEAL